MYIAMNRFRIASGFEDRFVEVWRTRDSKLDTVPGFVEFKMLKGGDIEGGVTALASISPISETNLAAAQRRLPLTQRSYYRVLIKGEELKAKPGRADDFKWQGG